MSGAELDLDSLEQELELIGRPSELVVKEMPKQTPPQVTLSGSTASASSSEQLQELEGLRKSNKLLQDQLIEMQVRLADLEKQKAEERRARVASGSSRGRLAGGDSVSFTGYQSYEVDYNQIALDQQVGGGGFSIVYLGWWHGSQVAVKKWFDPEMSEELKQDFQEEMLTLKSLRHPHIIQLLGACMKPPELCLVFEFFPYNLHSVLHESNIELDRKRITGIAKHIVSAFSYLHSRKPQIVHRDIKPANLLLNRAWHVKLCDFGLACGSEKKRYAGTPAYMAPELLEGKSYNEKVDVYAFGILFWEMMSRLIPFDGLSISQIKEAIVKGERPMVPLSCPRPYSNIIQSCWDGEASKRPSFTRLSDDFNDLVH